MGRLRWWCIAWRRWKKRGKNAMPTPRSLPFQASLYREESTIGLEDVLGDVVNGAKAMLFPLNDSNICVFLWSVSTCN